MNKVYEWPAVVTTSLTIGILYILCALFVLISSAKAVGFFGSMFHGIDLSKIAVTTITWSSFFIGLIITVILTAVVTFFVVLFYNMCLNHCVKKGWIKEAKK